MRWLCHPQALCSESLIVFSHWRGAQLTQEVYARAAEAMKRIGWKRPNKAGTARFDGKLMAGFVRGDRQQVITASRWAGVLHVGPELDTLVDNPAPSVRRRQP
jgi:hypothetical protein